MFGAAICAGNIYAIASGLSAVTDLVDDRIHRNFVPQEPGGLVTPFLVYRMPEPAIDDGPMGAQITAQTVRFEVAFYDDGPQVGALIPAAEALHNELHDLDLEIPGYQITCRREYEVPDLDPEFGMTFVRVGGMYIFDVCKQ